MIKCPVCQRSLAEETGTEWLKVKLPGVREDHFIYVKEAKCECGWKLLSPVEEISNP